MNTPSAFEVEKSTDRDRFRRFADVGAYLGLTPRHHQFWRCAIHALLDVLAAAAREIVILDKRIAAIV
jgi:hypothetical protein